MATATKMARKPAKPARRPTPKAAKKTAPAKTSANAIAVAMRDYFVKRLELEHATTARVLQNVQPGTWRPDPKSRSAVELAWHIAHSEHWFYDSILAGNFDPSKAMEGATPATMKDIIRFHDSGFTAKIAGIKKLSGAHMARVTDFFGMKHPMYEYLGFGLVHTVHHRAQLSTYLRALGGKVPDIYGGSADEPFEG